MRHVYLDHNVVTPLLKNQGESLLLVIEEAKRRGCRFPYSPAHIEEIAVIYRREPDFAVADGYVTEHLHGFSSLTDDLEYLPAEEAVGPARIVTESPFTCMGRVLERYHLTHVAEEATLFIMSSKTPAAFEEVQRDFGTNLPATEGSNLFEHRRERFGIDPVEINNLAPEQLFDLAAIREALDSKLWNHSASIDTLARFPTFDQSFNDRQNSILLVLNFMEEIGYRPDPFKKYRSQMHDVTHAIYGSMADVFVTADERFSLRLRATYHFLEVPTRILSPDEFAAWVAALPEKRKSHENDHFNLEEWTGFARRSCGPGRRLPTPD